MRAFTPTGLRTDLPTPQIGPDQLLIRVQASSVNPVDKQGRMIGLLTLRGVRRVPREQWPARRVREHMVPLGDQVVVAPDARMDGVLGKLEDSEAGRVLVVQDGEVVGIITPSDLTRWLRRWRAVEGRAP